MNKFTEKFDNYVCIGDSIETLAGIMRVTARLEYDDSTTPYDADCYSTRAINRWKRNEWFYCGVVLSVSIGDIVLTDHAASLWGIECNFNKQGNKYLNTVANELLPEAIENAMEVLESLLTAVKQGENDNA